MTAFFIVALVMILAYALNFEYHAKKFGVSTSHSSKTMAAAIIAEIKANIAVQQNLKIVDPGCGSGALVRAIGRTFPQAEVIGLELSPAPYWQARFLRKLFGPINVHFLKSDFFKFNYADADVIVTFLPEPVLHKLAVKLKQDLKPGALVLSNAFEMPDGWASYKNKIIQPILKRRLYCYRHIPT